MQNESADTRDEVDVDLLDYLQSLTPEERVRRNDDAAELVRALREAGKRHYGFDPQAPQDAD